MSSLGDKKGVTSFLVRCSDQEVKLDLSGPIKSLSTKERKVGTLRPTSKKEDCSVRCNFVFGEV